MPNNASTIKRLRQSKERRLHNRKVRSEIRTRTRNLFDTQSADEAREALSELYSALDRAARRRIIPPNAASRQKARLARHVRDLTSA